MADLTLLLQDPPGSAIIFKLPGYKPDVQLEVLGQIFEVHSIVLKIHSKFFRQFLDSPEKADRPVHDVFKYSWKTEIDTDGNGWNLVSSTSPEDISNDGVLTWDAGRQLKNRQAFCRLLQAVYSRPYELDRAFGDFELLCNLADYYSALPALSSTLGSALLRSPDFVRDHMKARATDLIVYATKLRNAALFRECVVWLCSAWSSPLLVKSITTLRLEHPKVYKVLKRACGDVALLAISVHDHILALDASHKPNSYHKAIIQERRLNSKNSTVFFRRIKAPGLDLEQEIRDSIELLCQNRLAMNSDQADMDKGFFCAIVEDEDLPWDFSELEW